MLAAVEKLSFRRGQEDDVSLFEIEDVPSFNCFANSDFQACSSAGEPVIEKLARQVSIFFFICCFA